VLPACPFERVSRTPDRRLPDLSAGLKRQVGKDEMEKTEGRRTAETCRGSPRPNTPRSCDPGSQANPPIQEWRRMKTSSVKNRPPRPGGGRVMVRPAKSPDLAGRWFNVKHRKDKT
jgi:hypothetical protein